MPGPETKADVYVEGSSRRNDFVDLQDMNGAMCGAKQARILNSYDSWARTAPSPSSVRGRHVDGLARFRQAALVPAVGASGG